MTNNETAQKKSSIGIIIGAILVTLILVSGVLYYKVLMHEKEIRKYKSITLCTVNLQRLYEEIPAKVALDPKKTQADMSVYSLKTSKVLEQGLPECSIILIQGVVFGNSGLIDVTDKVINTVLAD